MSIEEAQELMNKVLDAMGWKQGAIVVDGDRVVALLMGEDQYMESVNPPSKNILN